MMCDPFVSMAVLGCLGWGSVLSPGHQLQDNRLLWCQEPQGTQLDGDLSLFAGLEGEMLQQGGDGHFQSQESKPHPNAVPGTSPKGQERVRV